MRRLLHPAKVVPAILVTIVLSGCGGSGASVSPNRTRLSSESGSFSQDGDTVGIGVASILASGTWGVGATGTVETWSSPLIAKSGGSIIETGYRVILRNVSPEPGSSLKLRIRPSVSATDKVWRLAGGTDDSFEALASRGHITSDGSVEFEVPQRLLKSASRGPDDTVEGDFTVAWYNGRLAVEPRLFKNPNYGAQSNYSCSPTDDTLVELSAGDNVASGDRVAIIVHGLNNSADDMPDMAYIASHIVGYFGGGDVYNGAHRYDKIWFFDYQDSASGIDVNGDKLASLLNARGIANAKSVDYYGHSMGGLVSRWAIEKGGLGSSADRLFTFGTPHKGVPKQVLGLYGWALSYFVPGIDDLAETSDFITVLNRHDSPYKNQVVYYALAGSDYNYFWSDTNVFTGFGFRVRNWYDVLGWTGPIDGIVAEYSAIPGDLNRFGRSNLFSTKTLHLNHSDIGGIPAFAIVGGTDHPINTTIVVSLRAMLKASGSGVIR